MHLAAEHEEILHKRLRIYATLTAERRARFGAYVAQFLREKRFVAESNMVIDDDVRVTIAGTAVRLVLDLGLDRFRDVRHVIVYPHTVPIGGLIAAGAVASNGRAVDVHLGWAQVLKGLENPRDGFDVVLHEFAHVIDHHSGQFDGTPTLRPSQDYELWAHVLHRSFLDLFVREDDPEPGLRTYARRSPAELFAVATEAFFERPELLEKTLPALYLKLKRFYGDE